MHYPDIPLHFKSKALVAATVLLIVVAGALLGAHLYSGHACNHAPESGGTAAEENQIVKVTVKREGNRTRFFVENNEHCEVTMTFDVSTENLKGSAEFPYTASFPPRQVTEAFYLEPEKAGEKWKYSYTNFYKLGNYQAEHEDSFLYALPYASGSRFKVTQAFGGSYSHKGSNLYAIDWKMPEGTPIHAARGGEVVKIKQDSDKGGPSMKYDRYNNYVLIRHSDGTLGHYCHLSKDSVLVRPGDRVSTGDVLARSGNTGFSSGPHLHFCVFRTKDGKTRESVPVKFRVEGGSGTTLVAGRNYRAAPNSVTATVTSDREDTKAVGSAGGAGS